MSICAEESPPLLEIASGQFAACHLHAQTRATAMLSR
jgi:hypothetical protein